MKRAKENTGPIHVSAWGILLITGMLIAFAGCGLLILNWPLLMLFAQNVSLLGDLPVSVHCFLIPIGTIQILMGALFMRGAMRWIHHSDWSRAMREMGWLLILVVSAGLGVIAADYFSVEKGPVVSPAPAASFEGTIHVRLHSTRGGILPRGDAI